MAELKTSRTKQPSQKFLDQLEDVQKQKDGKILLKMRKEISGAKPVMWRTDKVGFGSYLHG